MHTEDLKRKQVGPGIPTHPPDPAAAGDQDKIVADEQVVHGADYNQPPPEGAAKSMGTPLDEQVGGPGLGLPPEGQGGAAGTRDRDTRAGDDHPPHREERDRRH